MKSQEFTELPETITVDGTILHTRNQLGKQIHPTQQGIVNFWKWFRGSQIVDEQGRPKIVYHGSPYTENIEKFDREYVSVGGNSQYGYGFYFSANSSVADAYTHKNAEFSLDLEHSPGITPCYISMRNPKKIQQSFNEWELTATQALRVVRRGQETIRDINETPLWNFVDLTNVKCITPQLIGRVIREYGPRWNLMTLINDFDVSPSKALANLIDITRYDGVIVGEHTQQVYVAWQPNRIKSAIGNNGRFHPRNDNITEDMR